MSSRLTKQTIADNYSTYFDQQTGQREKHALRLYGQAILAVTLSIFVKDLSDDSISVLVTALSILIGFAFAAMFPIALESISGLPSPLYAEDRDDIKVIRQLSVYFRYNVAYFIPLALASVIVLVTQMLNPSVPDVLIPTIHWIQNSTVKIWHVIVFALKCIPYAIVAASLFLLQECCYTFYRMCFNALALLRIKEEYVANRPDQ